MLDSVRVTSPPTMSGPTPAGVPVAITSPTSSVITVETQETSFATPPHEGAGVGLLPVLTADRALEVKVEVVGSPVERFSPPHCICLNEALTSGRARGSRGRIKR
jgi:hypothetical protein